MPETIVVDCSVAAKWVLAEPGGEEALGMLLRERAGELSLIAPDLLLVELAGLLAKKVRTKQISSDHAKESFRFVRYSPVGFFATSGLVEDALNLAIDHHMSLWDAVYLALAIERNCPMITADRRLFRGHSPRHPAIRFLH